MQIILISDMKIAEKQVLEVLGSRSSGTVLIVDSASVGTPIAPENRGGTATRVYTDQGATVQIVDLLETGPIDLTDVDVVHFTGGDPFRLLRACHASGFREAMETRDLDRPLAVVGSSAGAMVMGSDVGHAAILCDPAGLSDTRGFDWHPGRIMPHLDMKGAYGDKIREHVRNNMDEDWTLLHENDCLSQTVLFDSDEVRYETNM